MNLNSIIQACICLAAANRFLECVDTTLSSLTAYSGSFTGGLYRNYRYDSEVSTDSNGGSARVKGGAGYSMKGKKLTCGKDSEVAICQLCPANTEMKKSVYSGNEGAAVSLSRTDCVCKSGYIPDEGTTDGSWY